MTATAEPLPAPNPSDAEAAFRHGAETTLNHLLGLITNDRASGVGLDEQRILAAIATTRRTVLGPA